MKIPALGNSFGFLVGKNNIQNTVSETIGVLSSLFGCWHSKLTRPMMADKITYRACVRCGARRNYDPKNLRNDGRFYYPAVKKMYE